MRFKICPVGHLAILTHTIFLNQTLTKNKQNIYKLPATRHKFNKERVHKYGPEIITVVSLMTFMSLSAFSL